MTTLGTQLSGAAGAGSWRGQRGKGRDAAVARLAGTVWARSELAVSMYRGALGLGAVIGRWGISANAVTYLSLGFAGASTVAAALGDFGLAALLVVVSGVCDALDGVVARTTGTVTRYGALLDSTIDRVTDALPLLGILLFFGQNPLLALVPALAMISSFVIPYARARAEALGVALPGLVMRRPERLVLLVLFLLLGELPVPVPLAAPLLLAGLAVLTALNVWGAVTLMRAAGKALAEAEEGRIAGSKPAASGHA